MLEEIRIQGLGVIADAVLEFGPGLTVVTGETGAGKTMVLTGLALLFGERADSSRLRPGVDSAAVEGRLRVGEESASAAIVTDAGGAVDDDGTLLLRRVVTAGGRSRAVAGGASVPSAVLSRLSGELLVVHGQSDQQRLIRPAEQRRMLDRYAAIDISDCAAAFGRWRAAEEELEFRTTRGRELAREADLLRFGIAEIEALAPRSGEDLELEEEMNRLQHADALRVAARTAHALLSGDSDDPAGDATDVQTLLGAARKALAQVAGTDPELDQLSLRLNDLIAGVSDLGLEVADYEVRLEADPLRLAAIHERRAALAGLVRKYGPDLTSVIEWARSARTELASLDTSDDALTELRAARDRARADYVATACEISARRSVAALELSGRVSAELAGLAMPNARFTVSVRPRPPVESQPQVVVDGGAAGATAEGVDEVEMLLQPHADAPALAVQRGASGGELSRVMLALEVVLAGADPVPTMVFDEVDAGVGGRAAVEVGRRLSRLGVTHQVIVVTHLAQVAAFADHHLVVDKQDQSAGGGVTRSDVRTVGGDDRLAELARMLSGDDTRLARRHAAELLAAASSAEPITEPAGGAGNGPTGGEDAPTRRGGRRAAPAKRQPV